ncbi:hypothetical protein QT381_02710 [Galbitalea sp. SE-J8]|uniref:hypothetical protein n=1 Tax=Galbitalea sp. SE-J8 TaxID=3054952 RepID=UPI00259D2AC3|nr:hypothetical protein [Galbitalea sp. SE-J8]MDM4761915.1 hypothetical protein [Galbitalea sp. SE-J8]
MAVTAKTRREVIARDESFCGWCGLYVDTASGQYSLQHRRARGMGGSKRMSTDLHANLVLLHGTGTTGCHGYIEAHRDEARERGFNLTQQLDPAAIPIGLKVHGVPAWALFDNLAGRRFITETAAFELLEQYGLAA